MFIFYSAFQEPKVAASQCNTNSKQIANKYKGRLLIRDRTDGDKHTLIDMNQRKSKKCILKCIVE